MKGLLSIVTALTVVTATWAQCVNPDTEKCKCKAFDTLYCHNLDDFPEPDSIAANITELIFTNMAVTVTKIPKLNYPRVTILMIGSSGISDIEDGAFELMPDLESLEIDNCKLDELRSAMFEHNARLKKLDLDNNQFTSLPPKLFLQMPSLRTLNLDFNDQLQFTDTTFTEVPDTLRQFSCIKCGFTEIPEHVLDNMENLERLVLNQNQFTTIKDSPFEDLKSLTDLELDNCGIESISEDAFKGLRRLKTLRMGTNKLTEIPRKALRGLDELVELELEDNQLSTLHEDLVDWDAITTVQLEGNPWQCDCDLYWMRELQYDSRRNTSCATPEEYAGRSVRNATSEMSGCSSGSNGSTIALAIAIPIIIVCVFLIGYYVYKICVARKKKGQRKSVRYSAVYRDTTEAKQQQQEKQRPTSEL